MVGLAEPAPGVLSGFDKDRQVVFVDAALLIVGVFPDKAAVVAILRDDGIADDLPVLVVCVAVKQKEPSYEGSFLLCRNTFPR